MAAQGNLSSTAITNLGLTPPFRPTSGQEGGGSPLQDTVGIAPATTTGATTGGILRMVRLPSNAIVRDIYIAQEAATTTADFHVGAYYSNSTTDGTKAANVGLVLDADFFATSVDTHLLIVWTSVMFEATTVKVTDTVKPLWEVLSLTEDPGGYIDLTLTNVATISGAAILCMRVVWTRGGRPT